MLYFYTCLNLRQRYTIIVDFLIWIILKNLVVSWSLMLK